MKEEALKELFSDLSIEEKIGQLVQMPGYFVEDGSPLTGPGAELGFSKEELYNVGSTLSVFGADKIKQIQDEYIANQPHHIPLLFMGDIINGYQSIYPIPLAQGCSFDPELSRELAHMAAEESSAAGLHVTFSPMVDLVRDARWGRVMESTGEDTYLNSQFSAAMVRGYQGDDLKNHDSVAACVKHFAAYGAPEGGRDYNTVELSERTLRDDYLPAYKAAVDAGVALVMTSFNTIDRIPASANRKIMRDVLRDEWKFDGVLISDWGAIEELMPNGIAADEAEACELAMKAGVDIDMCTSIYCKQIKSLIEKGVISVELLDEAVYRVLALKNALGLFEDPYHGADVKRAEEVILSPKNRWLCLEAAQKSMVLLKNKKDILPLEIKDKKIAFIGPYAQAKQLSGVWSLLGKQEDTVSIEEGVLGLHTGNKYRFSKGCRLLDCKYPLYGFRGKIEEEDVDDNKFMEEAINMAKWADEVVLCLGEHPAQSGEGASRGGIRLPSMQRRLLSEVAKVNPNVITVLFCGRPLDIRDVEKKSKAILVAWFPGIEGGNAVAGLLFGVCSPQAKLSMSFPYCVGQVPVHYDHFPTGRPFDGNLTNRFQSKYTDIPNDPLYPFGYGLTYTHFSYSGLSVSKDTLSLQDANDTIDVSVKLKNEGNVNGVETVQLYIRDVAASVVRPVRKLKGFCKTELKPGEERIVSFKVTADMLSFTDVNMKDSVEPGEFLLFVGGDSQTTDSIAINVIA